MLTRDKLTEISINDGDRSALDSAWYEIERLQRRLEVAGYERERFQALNDALVKKLAAISLLTCPDDVVLPDGRRYAFKPPDDHVREAWEGLTKAIRSIDETLQQNAEGLQALPTKDTNNG